MPASSSDLISATEAFGERSETSVYLILSAVPLLGSLLQSLLDPIAYLFGALLGLLSGAEIYKPLLDILPTNTLKNAYVAGTVGFFLIVNLLGKILLPVFPVVLLLAGINAIVAALLGAVAGLLAVLLGPLGAILP